MSVEVANESGVEVDERALAALSRYVLDRMRINPLAELSVLLVDADAMAGEHERWMGESGPTDVLAFPMEEVEPGTFGPRTEDEEAPPTLLGDVLLCPQVAAEQAAEAGHSTEAELHLLCTHGILHLLGYDHADPDAHREMFGLQAELLGGWGAARGITSGGAGP